jgi:hypothetical protein
MVRALAERGAIEQRALSLAKEAIAARHSWVRPLGDVPSESVQRERWFREVSTVAAYRDPLASRVSAPSSNRRRSVRGRWLRGSVRRRSA